MDLREKKTLRAIHNAFLQLRQEKPLERIRVKELAELAEISKGTFYLHYKDIYDLSEKMQNDIVDKVMSDIDHPEAILNDKTLFTTELCDAFLANINMINILFADNQDSKLSSQVEKKICERVKELFPDFEKDPMKQISITYQVYGGYYAFKKYYESLGVSQVIHSLGKINKKL